MKYFYLALSILTISLEAIVAQNVGINSNGGNPDPSALLDLNSTTEGLLIPRMTTVQRDGISAAANSLIIYNTTDNCFQARNAASGQWENMFCFSGCTSSPSSPTANAAINIGLDNFDANWSNSSGATNYYIDVDDNSDFSSPLAGYNNFNVGNAITVNVTGLTCGTTYYYRVRASNDCGTSANSNSITTVYPGTCPVNCLGAPMPVVDVISGTGETWMDRNLGASQVATSSTDASSYGDLYQWGRFSDGHQCRTSGTTSTNATTDNPGHGNFITAGSNPYDWRVPQNDNLWQGVNGTNNPCPSGYRLPTSAEWQAEASAFSPVNSSGAFNSPLKLPVGGRRDNGGSFLEVGIRGNYWSSTAVTNLASFLFIYNTNAVMNDGFRARGFSVRCIKD